MVFKKMIKILQKLIQKTKILNLIPGSNDKNKVNFVNLDKIYKVKSSFNRQVNFH